MRRWVIPIVVAIILIGLILAVAIAQREPKRIVVLAPTPPATPSPLPTPTPTPPLTASPTPAQPTPTPLQSDNITVTSPRPNQVVSSPLNISGQARGTWFFEATAPVGLIDANGNNLATGFITAQGDWMTVNFVPFTGTLSFPSPATNNGQLILERSNPSGLPENDEQITIPVRFR